MIRLLFTIALIYSTSAEGQESYYLYLDAGKKWSDDNYKEAIDLYTKTIEINDFTKISHHYPHDYLVLSYFYRG